MSEDENNKHHDLDNKDLQAPKRARTRKRVTSQQISEFSEAEEAAQAGGFNLDFLNPVGLEPKLTRAAMPLALAITTSVNQGKQHGAAFLAKIEAANPNKLSESDKESIIARHNWEAAQKPRRPKLSRHTKPRAPSVPSEGIIEKGGSSISGSKEQEPVLAPMSEAEAMPTSTRSEQAISPVSISFVDTNPSKYGEDPNPEGATFTPRMPQQPEFTWSRKGENIANNFFRAIYYNRPIEEIIAAAQALNSDPEALDKVRKRGSDEAEYLPEVFRELGLI